MDDAGKTDPRAQSVPETRAHSRQGTPAAHPAPPPATFYQMQHLKY